MRVHVDEPRRDEGALGVDRPPRCPEPIADGGYRAVYLHTDPAVEGAEAFWRSLGKVVHDEREESGGGQGIVHFEIPMGR